MLTTAQYHSPLALRQVRPVTDPADLNFFIPNNQTWAIVLRTGEAIALYVCLCVLATIIIILVIFLVLQRESRRPLAKKVRTSGIWCPPLGPGLKPPQSALVLHTYTADALAKGKHRLPQSIDAYAKQENVATTMKCAKPVDQTIRFPDPIESLTAEASTYGRASSAVRTNVQSTSSQKRALDNEFTGSWIRDEALSRRKFARLEAECDTSSSEKQPLVSGAHEQESTRLQPSVKRPLSGNGLQEVNNESDLLRRSAFKQQPSCLYSQRKTNNKVHRYLRNLIQSQDGLHPISPHAVACLDCVSCTQNLQEELDTKQYVCLKQQLDECPFRSIGHHPMTLLHERTSNYVLDPITGETMLHMAARFNGGPDLALALPRLNGVIGSAEESAYILQADSQGRTALVSAAASDALDSTSALYQLEREATIASLPQLPKRNTETVVPASCSHTINSATASLTRPKRQKAVDVRQCTPLIAAVQAGNEELARYLIDEGYPLSGMDEMGRNVIHWAAATNSLRTLERLATCKGFHRLAGARDDEDRTPLMLATREGCTDAVRFLLQQKVNVLHADCLDNDPLKIARDKGFTDIEQMLLPRCFQVVRSKTHQKLQGALNHRQNTGVTLNPVEDSEEGSESFISDESIRRDAS
ncbi:unnamed protein product [Dicrocoelium dendriticum]|nr:unnamed protein product [Dicrocoelium dendriticum]